MSAPSPRSQPQSGTRLVAGRALDARIAETVMGWGWVGRLNTKWFAPLATIGTDGDGGIPPIRAACDSDVMEQAWWLGREKRFGDCEIVPPYSTDIAAAWTVVEKLTATDEGDAGVEVMVKWSAYSRRWCAQIHDLSGKMRFANEKADSASHAICLAALAALADANPLSRPDDGGARP